MIENVDSFLYLVSQFLLTALPVVAVIALVFFVIGRSLGKRTVSRSPDTEASPEQLASSAAARRELSARLDVSETERRALAARLDDESRRHDLDLKSLKEEFARMETTLAHSRRQLEEQREAIHSGDVEAKKGFWHLVSPKGSREASSLIQRLEETTTRLEDQEQEARALKDRISAAAAALEGSPPQESK
jgi:chromosome segregation ATPase